MKELIKITEQNGNRAVSARELHKFLEVETPFRKWIDRMLEYGFEESKDYSRADIFVRGNQAKNFALTIDTAKEISMLQKTEKGKEARRYFIEMEKINLDRLLQDKNFQKITQSTVANKRIELLKLIRFYLQWGDMTRVAENLGFSSSYVRQVALNLAHDTENAEIVFNELYKKALQNKKEVLFDYQQMIDTLKE